ncbi:MAG: ubiquinone biosynthesis regulatory protein kinase UbiB, partial [Shewanella sp.]
TAKPFLEQWMTEQVGPKAMFNKVKANLPSWSDKMPELPELIYDNLTMGKKLLGSQQKLLDRYIKHQRQLHKSNYLLISSASLLICGTIFFNQQVTLWPAIVCLSTAAILWLWGWRSRPNNRKL